MTPDPETGLNEGDLALMEADVPQRSFALDTDDEPNGKTFPWRQIMAVMRRYVPELNLPVHADRRDAVMKKFWRDRGKTISAFELLAQGVAASDFIMARNGHTGSEGRPYPWSWIFAKTGHGQLRADKILAGDYSNDKMSFVLEKEERVTLTKVMRAGAAVDLNLRELWNGEPRYKLCGEHANGLPVVFDRKD